MKVKLVVGNFQACYEGTELECIVATVPLQDQVIDLYLGEKEAELHIVNGDAYYLGKHKCFAMLVQEAIDNKAFSRETFIQYVTLERERVLRRAQIGISQTVQYIKKG